MVDASYIPGIEGTFIIGKIISVPNNNTGSCVKSVVPNLCEVKLDSEFVLVVDPLGTPYF